MIKSLLKAVFPRTFLKKVFLVANKLKIRTVDKILFPPLNLEPKDFLIHREVNPFRMLQIDLSNFSSDVRDRLKIWTDPNWKQDEYVLIFDGIGYIEPKVGWGITIDKKLIYPSLGLSRAPHVHKPDLFEMFSTPRKKIELKEIVSLRDTGEENYFHFFNDVIAKLYFLRDAGLDLHSFTIVISKKLYEKEYFKIIKEISWIQELTFHVQDDEWIKFEKAVFCKPLTHTSAYFQQITGPLLPLKPTVMARRIFITRNSKTLRFVDNMEELLPVLSKYDFEIIDAASLPFLDQVNIFSECNLLIGVHGAGLTNMIFRNGRPLSVLEIAHPFEYIPFHYIMLSRQYNYRYNVILGKKSKSAKGGFRVDPRELENAMKDLLV